jgi:glycosyltransferase involved in cell wall biosynthesis
VHIVRALLRVHVVDPSAFTLPYDAALSHALGSRALPGGGALVTLYTSRFAYGSPAPVPDYRFEEPFYRRSSRLRNPRVRRLAKAFEHVPDMLAYRRVAASADVVHFQWLAVQQLDLHLLPSGRPLVLTAHDVLPREGSGARRSAQRKLYGRVDAVVAHSEHSRRRLVDELEIAAERVHVIPHGPLRPWEGQSEAPLPLPATKRPVVLFFGLLRPYKGLDLLMEAWRGITDAELWVVGMPRGVDIARLDAPAGVRFLPRFVGDGEMHALMRHATMLVAPYREIEQSGAVFTALGAGLPVVLSDVGGFPELASTGAVELFPSGDAGALREAISRLLSDPTRREAMAAAALSLEEGEWSWARIAERTLALYRSL